MKKLLAVDLDGTLLTGKKQITPGTRQAILELIKQGNIFVVASGRPTQGAVPVVRDLDLARYGGYLLCYNGAMVMDCVTGGALYRKFLPDDAVREIFSLADTFSMGMVTYNENGMVANMHHDEFMDMLVFIDRMELHHYERPTEQLTESVHKCLGTAPASVAPEIEKKFAAHFGDRIHVIRSEPFFIEFVPHGIDKGKTLAWLARKLGVAQKDVIACGDGFNDTSMVQFAGLGVAMANAQQPLKEVADYIAPSNEEEGVAEVIKKFVLD